MISENPFNTGSPARGEGFLGRDKVIRNIITFLNKKFQYNLLIFGQRRIGKTSLLRKLQDDPKLHDSALPVYFNLQDKARIELPRLLFEIASRIISDLELSIQLKEIDRDASGFTSYFQNDFIPQVIHHLPPQKQLLLLFDEFDVLGETEDVEDDSIVETFASKQFINFTAKLINEMQEKKYPIKFIFAIGRNYKDLEPKRFGQIMKFGSQEELSYFSQEETIELLKSSDDTIPFEPDAMAELSSLTSGHPYFSQCLASVSFDAAEKENARSITPQMVRSQLINSIKSYSSGVYWIWDSLSANDQIILYLMASLKEEGRPIDKATIREKAATLNVLPVIEKLPQTTDKLMRFKFIKDNKQGGYDFYVEFIRRWVVKEVSETEIEKQLDQIDEDIKFHLNNARYFFKKKDYKQALIHFGEILKNSPYHFEALFYSARCYKYQNKDDTNLEIALEFYKKSYDLNRHKAKREYLGLLYEKLDQLEKHDNLVNREDDKGISLLMEIQKVEPGDSKIAEKIVEIYIVKGMDISELEYLANVTEINLGNKRLRVLTKQVALLENLRRIDLRYNELTELPPELFDMGLEVRWEDDSKDGILLANNPLEDPPMKIVEQGTGAIKQYFQTLEGDQLRAERSRLLIENADLKDKLANQKKEVLRAKEEIKELNIKHEELFSEYLDQKKKSQFEIKEKKTIDAARRQLLEENTTLKDALAIQRKQSHLDEQGGGNQIQNLKREVEKLTNQQKRFYFESAKLKKDLRLSETLNYLSIAIIISLVLALIYYIKN